MREQPGPRQVAETEAAKQAVALLFSIVGAVLLLAISKRMHASMAGQLGSMLPGHAERQMREALAAADVWDRRAAYLFKVGLGKPAQWAHSRAEAARAAYEAARP